MPFKSKAQMRLFFAKERRGELPKGKAEQWAKETKNISSLPERKKKKKKASDLLAKDIGKFLAGNRFDDLCMLLSLLGRTR